MNGTEYEEAKALAEREAIKLLHREFVIAIKAALHQGLNRDQILALVDWHLTREMAS